MVYDFIVVGAGVVGPAMAKGLAKHGKKVLVLERDLSEPDRIVGELLQPGGIESLKKLGMEEAVEGIDAAPIYGYDVNYEGESVVIPYPVSPKEQSSKAKPVQGRGFHHGKFIMNLRRIAQETPGVTFKEATVREIIEENGRVVGVKDQNDEVYRAHIVSVCDGISSNFRKQYVDTKPVVKSHFVGTILTHPEMHTPNHGNVVIGSNFSPMLVYQISSTEARILCNVPLAKLPSNANGDLKRWLEENSLPHLPAGLRKSFAAALENEKLRSMPNQYLPAIQYEVPGLVILGDAMNMRHPLTGGGMTVGFRDAYIMSNALGKLPTGDLLDHTKVNQIVQDFRTARKRSSVVINVLSIALYHLFAAETNELKILQNGCFEYFRCGGDRVKGPVSILSGLTPNPYLLFYHFFAVAFYSIQLNFADKIDSRGFVGFMVAFYQMFTTLWTASAVFLPFMIKEIMW